MLDRDYAGSNMSMALKKNPKTITLYMIEKIRFQISQSQAERLIHIFITTILKLCISKRSKL